MVTVVVSAATTAEASVALPETFALSDSYPNPFSRETTVRVDVPEVAAVRVSVFDLLGRRVAVLVDAPLEAGYHQLRWNASDLPSGAYLIRMEAGSFAATQRITLVR